MTEKETDLFLSEALKEILAEIKENREYIKDIKWPEYDEVREDYNDAIKQLEKLCRKVKSVDDLAETDDDAITFVYDCIEGWSDNMVISADESQMEKDLKKYNDAKEFLGLFEDDEDFDEEEDSEDEGDFADEASDQSDDERR